MDPSKELKLAVLIDADNVSATHVKSMLEEIAKYGTPTFKRIYGDWTRPQLGGWKKVLLENAITPVQQYSYTSGKNSTDSAMIIEAMDILYTGGVDGFCIVSSDSDFTRLATRLREAGKKVFGIGQRKTPAPFIASCNKFIYLEILQEQEEEKLAKDEKEEQAQGDKSRKAARKTAKPTGISKELINLIQASINDLSEDDGWVFLGTLGSLILKKQPDFDPRNFGYKKLVDFIKQIPKVELDERQTGKNNISHFYVRVK